MKVLFIAVNCDGNPFGLIDFAMIEIDRLKNWIQNAQILLEVSRSIKPAVTDTIVQRSCLLDPADPLTNPVMFLSKTTVDNYVNLDQEEIELMQQHFDFFLLELRKIINPENPYYITEITDEAFIWLSSFAAENQGTEPTCHVTQYDIYFTHVFGNVFYTSAALPITAAIHARIPEPTARIAESIIRYFKPHGTVV